MSPRSARLATFAAWGLAAVTLTACGGDTEGNDAQALGDLRAGTVAPLAQCEDWNAGTVDERFATVADIRAQISTNDPDPGNALSDEEAYEVFDSACSNDFADGFRLYKIYYRALAFQALADPPPED